MIDPDVLRPAFLMCSERSGSNLIRSMIDSHPDIYAPMPIHLIKFWHHVTEYGDITQDENWNLLLRHLAEMMRTRFGHVGFDILEEDLRRECQRRSFGAIYRYVYARGATLQGKQNVFIKEKSCGARIVDYR